MALFRRRTATVLKKSSTDVVEERKVFRIAGQTVEVRRVETAKSPAKQDGAKPKKADKQRKRSGRGQPTGKAPSRSNGRRPAEEEIIIPTDVGRRQMLVRSAGAQTQIVILE